MREIPVGEFIIFTIPVGRGILQLKVYIRTLYQGGTYTNLIQVLEFQVLELCLLNHPLRLDYLNVIYTNKTIAAGF